MIDHDVNTIADFGRQWVSYTQNTGYYASVESLLALFGPLLTQSDIQGKSVADIGAGTGRYTRMLSRLGAEKILALEPSVAIHVLRQNTASCSGIRYLHCAAHEIPPDGGFDSIFCIGVLQFIHDPIPSLKAIGKALNPNGKLFLWVYGEEHNRMYLCFLRPLRTITSRLPHAWLDKVSAFMVFPASLYALLCMFVHLPMADYMRSYFSRLNFYSRKLVVYDQLNPRYVKYYQKEELNALLVSCGFSNIRLYHHLGYSWSLSARYIGNSS